jgi:hypothetical protein
MVKVVMFGFLDAKDGACTFLYFFFDCITFIFRIQPSNIPIQNIPTSACVPAVSIDDIIH